MKKFIPVICVLLSFTNFLSAQSGTLTASKSIVYSGDNVTFQVTGYDPSAIEFIWFKYNGSTYVEVPDHCCAPQYMYPTTASGTSLSMYCLVIIGSTPHPTNTVDVTVLPAFNPGTISTTKTLVCYQDLAESLSFTTLPSGGDGSFEYQWQYSFDNSLWSNIAGQTICTPDFHLTQKTYFRCMVDAGAGQKATNTVVVDVANNFSQIIQTNQTICYGAVPEALTQSNTSGGKEPYVHQWQYSVSGVWTDVPVNGTNADYTPEKLYQTTYYRRITRDACTQENTSNTVTVVVRNLIIPEVRNNNKACNYTTQELNVADTFASYKWFDKNNNELGTNDTIEIGPLSGSLSYYFNCTDNNGCISDTIEVPIVVDLVTADFVVNSYEIRSGEEQKFINKSKGAVAYKWLLTENEVSTEVNPQFYYYDTGYYAVTLIAISEIGCQDTVLKEEAFKVIKGSAINNIYSSEFQLYPQPAQEFVNVILPENSNTVFSIYNLNGQKLKEIQLTGMMTRIDISDLSNGTYFIKIDDKNTQILIKK